MPTTTQAPIDRVPGVPGRPAGANRPARPDTGQPTRSAATPALPREQRPAPPAGNRAPHPDVGPATGPQGGRAALRAERQAADAVRRREDRRRGITAAPAPVEDERARGSRGLVVGLVAVVVIALVLLSVWSFNRSETDEAAQSRSLAGSASSTSQTPGAGTSAAPATPPAEVTTPGGPAPTGPVFAPVSVLNSAGISGLAAGIGDELLAGGWEIRTLGTYASDDVATTTVFYTEGDATQQQAAESLLAQFPEVSGPAVRFFEIPDLPEPGIVIIATGSWQP